MSLKINKDLLYCNEVKIVSNSDLIVEVIKKDNTITEEKINTSIEDYYDINTDTNFQIIDNVVDRFEDVAELANFILYRFLKYDYYDYHQNSIASDILNSLNIFYDNREEYKSIQIIELKNFSYKVEEFEVIEDSFSLHNLKK